MKSELEICPQCNEPRASLTWSSCHCGYVYGTTPTKIYQAATAGKVAPAKVPPLCPQCGEAMIDGVVCLESGLLGTLNGSLASLRWRRLDRQPLVLVDPGEYADAFRCEKCGTVVLPPRKHS